MKSNLPKFTKDDEFKISLSSEDIDKMDEEIKKLESNSKKTFGELYVIESENAELTEKIENHNVIDGVTLLNTCVTCHDKFKPIDSMTDESSCNVCSKRKQIS